VIDLKDVLCGLAFCLKVELASSGPKAGEFAQSYVDQFVRFLDDTPEALAYLASCGLLWETDDVRSSSVMPKSEFRAAVGLHGEYVRVLVVNVVGSLMVVRVGTSPLGRMTAVTLSAVHPDDCAGAEAFRLLHPGSSSRIDFEPSGEQYGEQTCIYG
jgi:hypothetical protein